MDFTRLLLLFVFRRYLEPVEVQPPWQVSIVGLRKQRSLLLVFRRHRLHHFRVARRSNRQRQTQTVQMQEAWFIWATLLEFACCYGWYKTDKILNQASRNWERRSQNDKKVSQTRVVTCHCWVAYVVQLLLDEWRVRYSGEWAGQKWCLIRFLLDGHVDG